MNYPVDDIGRIGMRRRPRGLSAATLVDGHVDQYRAWLPALDHGARDEFRRRRPWNEHAADDEVGFGTFILDRPLRGIEGLQVRAETGDKLLHPLRVLLQHYDVGTEPQRHGRRIRADYAAAEYHHLRRRHAGD